MVKLILSCSNCFKIVEGATKYFCSLFFLLQCSIICIEVINLTTPFLQSIEIILDNYLDYEKNKFSNKVKKATNFQQDSFYNHDESINEFKNRLN